MIDPALPLYELHRHLDGAIRLETILDLADQHGIELPARDPFNQRPKPVSRQSPRVVHSHKYQGNLTGVQFRQLVPGAHRFAMPLSMRANLTDGLKQRVRVQVLTSR